MKNHSEEKNKSDEMLVMEWLRVTKESRKDETTAFGFQPNSHQEKGFWVSSSLPAC